MATRDNTRLPVLGHPRTRCRGEWKKKKKKRTRSSAYKRGRLGPAFLQFDLSPFPVEQWAAGASPWPRWPPWPPSWSASLAPIPIPSRRRRRPCRSCRWGTLGRRPTAPASARIASPITTGNATRPIGRWHRMIDTCTAWVFPVFFNVYTLNPISKCKKLKFLFEMIVVESGHVVGSFSGSGKVSDEIK